MKLFIIFIFILNASFLAAQEKETSVEMDSKAILFSFSGLDNLNANTFNGGIGAKYFINNDMAIRVGIQLNSFTETTPSNADSTQIGRDGESSNFRFGIDAAVEWHITSNRVSPYLGGGVSYSNFSSERFPPAVWPENSTSRIFRTTQEVSGADAFAIFGIAGVEVFITKVVSLAAEYHLIYENSSEGDITQITRIINGEDLPQYPISETTQGNSTNTFGFQSAGFLTLAIYL